MRKLIVVALFWGGIFAALNLQAAETMTVTTYYPSPYGKYQTLRLFPVSTITPAGPCSNPGEMVYDSNTNNVYVCTGSWDLFASSGGDVGWTLSGNILYSDDPAVATDNWLIGIGTQNPHPQSKIHIDPVPYLTNDHFIITNEGRVGIGIVSPISKLQLYYPPGNVGFFDMVNNNRDMWYSGDAASTFYFANAAGENGKTIISKPSGGVVSPMLSIISNGSGAVYIGTASPGSPPYYALRVADALRVTAQPSSGEYVVFDNIPDGTISNNLIDAGSGYIRPVSSSRRYKKDITDLEIDTAKVYDLRPVSFSWKESGIKDFGLIAEEVDKVLPEMVVYDQEGGPDSVKYQQLSVLLLAELKKLKSWADDLEAQISALEK
ncbi:MAG: tail fiber domain-containing protein [Candidatus Omnitrophica bacterium]|nr:tail fiber domain-containing protein [Candidatus Omnitrophota bacterium]